MTDAGQEVTGPCPNCQRESTLEVYDIGSGPELSCPHCEWCWGANGQELKPIRYDDIRHLIEETSALPPVTQSVLVIRIVRSALSRLIRTPGFFRDARERAQREGD